jgi:hypothetical protein
VRPAASEENLYSRRRTASALGTLLKECASVETNMRKEIIFIGALLVVSLPGISSAAGGTERASPSMLKTIYGNHEPIGSADDLSVVWSDAKPWFADKIVVLVAWQRNLPASNVKSGFTLAVLEKIPTGTILKARRDGWENMSRPSTDTVHGNYSAVLETDLSNYQINAGEHAIGLITEERTTDENVRGVRRELELFSYNSGNLNPIFNTAIHDESWDGSTRSYLRSATVTMGKTSTDGYFDILVKLRESVPKNKTKSHRMIYRWASGAYRTEKDVPDSD